MTDLIKRLEEAEAGSRELDIAFRDAVLPDAKTQDLTMLTGFADKPETHGERRIVIVENYTTSLDAALALAERVLPGWAWEIRMDQDVAFVQAAPKWWQEGLAAPDEDGVSAEGNTAALAICIAILKATDTGREG